MADFREEAYILEKMEISEDEEDGDFRYEEIKDTDLGIDASGTLEDGGLNFKDDEDDDDLNNFEALKAKTQMKAMQ
jgi:hypothetical protein